MAVAPNSVQKMAVSLAGPASLGADAKALLRPEHTVAAALPLLLESGHPADAVKLLAAALPKPALIWWGCLCTWHLNRPNPAQATHEVLISTMTWLAQPSEPNRRRLETLGNQVGTGTLAGTLAKAGFYCEGSIMAPEQPVLAPPPAAAAKTLAAGLVLETERQPRPSVAQHYRRYIQIGLDVSSGRNLWN